MVGLALPWSVLFCQIGPSSYTNDVKLGVRQVFKPIKKLTVRIKTNIWMAVIFQVEIIMHLSITGESCVFERRCHVYYSSTLENKLVINSIKKTVLQTIYQLYVKSGLFQKSYPIPTGSIKDVSKTSPKNVGMSA